MELEFESHLEFMVRYTVPSEFGTVVSCSVTGASILLGSCVSSNKEMVLLELLGKSEGSQVTMRGKTR